MTWEISTVYRIAAEKEIEIPSKTRSRAQGVVVLHSYTTRLSYSSARIELARGFGTIYWRPSDVG